MAIYCDACEHRISNEGKTKCCNSDVWAVLRADGNSYLCKACGEEVEYNEIKGVD